MCNTCGCNISHANRHLLEATGKLSTMADGKAAITVLKSLLRENDQQAMHNREHFDKYSVLVINLMSSPGAGKTALLEATIESLGGKYQLAVIEGDLETENDADRIRNRGITAIQITTGAACHLDAHMVHNALHQLDLRSLDIVFIENVGNLVCPASFDLGQHQNVILLSVPEGDDKPAKYPVMFRAADLMMLTKTDLLPVLDDFDPQKARQHLRNLANDADVIDISSKNGTGIDEWLGWIKQIIEQHKKHIDSGNTTNPANQLQSALMPKQTEPLPHHKRI